MRLTLFGNNRTLYSEGPGCHPWNHWPTAAYLGEAPAHGPPDGSRGAAGGRAPRLFLQDRPRSLSSRWCPCTWPLTRKRGERTPPRPVAPAPGWLPAGRHLEAAGAARGSGGDFVAPFKCHIGASGSHSQADTPQKVFWEIGARSSLWKEWHGGST